MKTICHLTDLDFGLIPKILNNPRHRFGARGIILNEKKEIAILYKENKNEYKLIGGGIEENETPIDAFLRESLEETGCIIEVDQFLGVFEEIKSQDNFIQTSYLYLSHVIHDTQKTIYTTEEIVDGAKILWLSLDKAMSLIKDCENKIIASKNNENMSIYHTKFVVRRDYEILNYYRNIT